MRRWPVIAKSSVMAMSLGSLALGLPALSVSAGASSHTSATSFNDAAIVTMCDQAIPNSSLGLLKPSSVSRLDGTDEVLFETSHKYSVCLVAGVNDVEGDQPTAYVRATKGIRELESFATLNKMSGARYRADVWFVVQVAPGVSTIETASSGRSQASVVKDGFVFVHVKETADIRGKFVYGIAAGFSANGTFLGSTPLS